jgi:hypothetical protein
MNMEVLMDHSNILQECGFACSNPFLLLLIFISMHTFQAVNVGELEIWHLNMAHANIM